jgi:RNA polymerase sigma-70 factor (ECF subfamily)
MQIDINEVYKTYSPRILLYLLRFVGKDDAEDLLQEVFIKVFKSLSSFKGESQIYTWIYKIATNTAMDKLKNSHYRSERSKATSLDYIAPLKALAKSGQDDNGIEYQLFKQEMNQCIADYINKLPDNYRAVFLLKEYDGFSFEEISEILDITVENVKIRLHRARKKLHEVLSANCSFYYDEYSKLSCDKK